MAFKTKIYNCYNPLCRAIAQWVFLSVFLLCFSDTSFAYSKKEIKNLPERYNVLMAVMKYEIKKEYSTISRTIGDLKYQVSEKPIVITTFKSDKVTLTISTFKEFYGKIQPEIDSLDFRYLNKLPEILTQYLEKIEANNLNLNINLIVLPYGYQVFYESDRHSIRSDKLHLTFITSYLEIGGIEKNLIVTFEKNRLNILSHEAFHLLDFYLSLIKTKSSRSLRKETYAEFFGLCIAYEIYPEILVSEKILNFSDLFFKDPSADLKKVRKKLIKKIKKNEAHEMVLSKFIARYYFQAVANNYTGKNISSNKIPKFCHKLFSEHNFKHPIEKRPPPWFKEFLEAEEN